MFPTNKTKQNKAELEILADERDVALQNYAHAKKHIEELRKDKANLQATIKSLHDKRASEISCFRMSQVQPILFCLISNATLAFMISKFNCQQIGLHLCCSLPQP